LLLPSLLLSVFLAPSPVVYMLTAVSKSECQVETFIQNPWWISDPIPLYSRSAHKP
jgi:hypothetical protein